MIKTIFFDLGEVILTNDWHYECPEKFEAYSEYFGITYDDMENGWNAAWPLYEIGKISEDEFWQIFLKKSGAAKIDIQKAKDLWKKYFGSKPGMFEILHKLKDKYVLAVYSSTGKEWLEYKIQKYNLNDYFSFYFTTSESGMKKTEKRMFETALNQTGSKPEESLLIDDTIEVLEVAKSLGIRVVRFLNVEQFERDLIQQGIHF